MLDMVQQGNVQEQLSTLKVKYVFNIESPPWWKRGGVLERMVTSTKRGLKKAIGGARLTFEELLTVITEMEMIINC